MLIYHDPDKLVFHYLLFLFHVSILKWDVPIKIIVCTVLPIQISQRQSEMWCIKNMFQASTAQLFLYMLAVKTNNVDP